MKAHSLCALATALGLGVGGFLPAQAGSYHAVYDPNAAYDPDAIYDLGTVQSTHPAYRAPGPAEDPWGPYIRQAARRFAIPETWIRAVMQQESGGKQYLNGGLTTSGAGAMGLMQLMPATYADMQTQYGLGGDPYNPKDNIQAGAAYIRLMYDRYGAPGFLAAYNAGPDRVDDYLNNGRHLPDETVDYVAAITPHLGGGVAVRGKWAPVPIRSITHLAASDAFYAKADLSRTADGCLRDPDAAYDPSGPCLMDRDTPHPDPEPEAASTVQIASAGSSDEAGPSARTESAATDSGRASITQASLPSAPVRQVAFSSEPAIRRQNAVYATAASPSGHVLRLPASYSASAGGSRAPAFTGATQGMQTRLVGRGGTVQVGAFASYAEAQRVADKVTRILAARSMRAIPTVRPVSVAGKAMYRAQLVADAGPAASGVCQILHARSMPCIPVRNS